MIAKCLCQECANPIEFEAEGAGQRINCPHCGNETLLAMARVAQPVPKAKSLPRPNALHLETIRANSCYQTLRGVIGVAFWLSVAALVLFVALSWVTAFTFGRLGGDSIEGIIFAIGITLAAFVVVVLLIAGRQSALLLVDIADTLLYQHSR